MKKLFPVISVITLFLFGCSKMEEKKTSDEIKPPVQQPPVATENKSSGMTDEKGSELVKYVEDAEGKYNNDKSDSNKKTLITSYMAAANYLMFDANLPAKEKYRPALKYYRKVLELEPKNQEAAANKKQIEDIYESMGMPIPQ